jgi:formylmethanofuran dehydrogenase subunit E
VYDADQHDADNERWLERRPVCKMCGEHIQDDWGYCIDGDWICERCMDDFRAYIDD